MLQVVVLIAFWEMLAITPPLFAALVAHWAMDEGSWNGTAGEVQDRSGYGNHGQAVNGATTGPGRIGRAGTFDGTDDYVEIPAANSLVLGSNGTVTAWVKFDTLPSGTHQILGSLTYQNGLLLNQIGGDFYTYWKSTGGPQVTVSNAFAVNEWYHLAMTNNGGSLRVYINGVLRGSGSEGTNNYTNQILRIGGLTSQKWNIDGLVDDVGIWNEGLNEAKVRSLYTVVQNLGLSYDVNDMVALWSFFDAQKGGAIKGIPWQYISSLPGSPNPGDAYNYNGIMYIALGGGAGLAAVPEPSSLFLASLGLVVLVWCGGRRKPVLQGIKSLWAGHGPPGLCRSLP